MFYLVTLLAFFCFMSFTSNDKHQFSTQVPKLSEATTDLCWLLSRGYNHRSALTLVGDKFQFTKRQRQAIHRAACSAAAIQQRASKQQHPPLITSTAYIDGFNILITIECALKGELLLRCRDGLIRDISATHGGYKQSQYTDLAIDLIQQQLHLLKLQKLIWFLDRPVSNSGKLAAKIREKGMEAEVVNNPDQALCLSQGLVISADGWVLEQSTKWYPLAEDIIATHIPNAWLLEL